MWVYGIRLRIEKFKANAFESSICLCGGVVLEISPEVSKPLCDYEHEEKIFGML